MNCAEFVEVDTIEISPDGAVQGRREKRYSTEARVRLADSELLLTDISLNGGHIQSQDFLDMVPSGKYTVVIVPEKEARMDQFEVEILSKWVRMRKSCSESGFIMIVPPGSGEMDDYIEFLKTKMTAD